MSNDERNGVYTYNITCSILYYACNVSRCCVMHRRKETRKSEKEDRVIINSRFLSSAFRKVKQREEADKIRKERVLN